MATLNNIRQATIIRLTGTSETSLLIPYNSIYIKVTGPFLFYFRMWVVSFAVILLDYASQATINPCESLMADILKSASNANTGFMIYSAMLSLGSCVGYLLSALDWSTLGQITGNSEQVRKERFTPIGILHLA